MFKAIWSTLSPRAFLIASFCLAGLIISLVALIIYLNVAYFVEVPAYGGQLTEGVLGAPRFVNPVLALTDADRDLTSLIFSGLVRSTAGPEPVLDLAKKYTVSPDGLTYTFTLKKGLTWQDGEALTARDVVFTIQAVENPIIKSPKWATWEGVTAEAVDNETVRFTLRQPNPSFLESATLGIIPEHIWRQVEPVAFAFAKENLMAIGSGPYTISRVRRNESTLPPEAYELKAFPHFALGQPKIAHLTLRFYPNTTALEKAWLKGEVASFGSTEPLSSQVLGVNNSHVEVAPLPRFFGLFFNQNQAEIFVRPEVRQALEVALDREMIIKEALSNSVSPVFSHVPPEWLNASSTRVTSEPVQGLLSTRAGRLAAARLILNNAGWKLPESTGIWELSGKSGVKKLNFTLTTADTPELKRVAEMVQRDWSELGAAVALKVFEVGDLNQNAIRERTYDALLFGLVVAKESDLASFWHSSQRLDPGLNIAMYTNLKVDRWLEEARKETEASRRFALYGQIESELAHDRPAIFLYRPQFSYLVPSRLRGLQLVDLKATADRFRFAYQWYVETDHVWPSLINK